MDTKKSVLLEPLKVRNTEFKNRIVFPPLTTGYEERDGSIGETSLAFYERLAKGGTAYIVIGDVAPVMTASPTPKLANDSQIASFARLAEAVHTHGSKLGLQIFHPEYDVEGVGKLIMASRMAGMEAAKAKAAGDMETFEAKQAQSDKIAKEAYAKLHHDMLHFVSEASQDQLEAIKEAMVACALRAQKAGVDAIEVHGDRLLGSLCSSILNHRQDEYGQSFEGRTKYALEVVKAIRKAVPDMVIEYKLPIVTKKDDGSLRGKGGLVEEEAVLFAKALEEAGADMIQVAQANHTGNMGDTIPPMGTRDVCWMADISKKIKDTVSVPVMTVGKVVSVENGEKLIEEGIADFVGYGRSLLTDPDLAQKAQSGEPVRECLNCNKGCVDAISGRRQVSCVLNAENGKESSLSILPGNGFKKVAVVGAGLAGLEAARVAALRGYDVDVFEKSGRIGGQIVLASVPPRKSEILRSLEYYDKILPLLNVKMHLNTAPDAEVLNGYDAVVAAVGAHNLVLPIPGSDSEKVLSAWDILDGSVVPTGKAVVIGGGLVGVETAEFLLEKGVDVAVVEMMDTIAAQESSTILPEIKKDFQDHNVQEYTCTKAAAVTDQGLQVVNTATQEEFVIPADYVVMAVGSVKNPFDESGLNVPVYYAGDGSGERTADISSAIRTGYSAANAI